MLTEIIGALVIGAMVGGAGWYVARDRHPLPAWQPVAAGAVLALLGAVLVNAVGLSGTSGLGWKDAVLYLVLSAIGAGAVIWYAISRGGRTAGGDA